MKDIKELFTTVTERLEKLARGNAVVAKPISVGERHILPLCELAVGFSAGGGQGEGTAEGAGPGAGVGGGAGGGAKAAPVAVLVIEGGKARIELLGR